MKKYLKLIYLLLFVVVMVVVIIFYRKNSFNTVVDNTIKNKDKINYTTSIELITENKDVSMKIIYEITRSSNIKKITIDSYKNNEVENNLLKYIYEDKAYVNNNGKYEEKENSNDDFNINYNYLSDKLISLKSKSGNKYIIEMNKCDAYNLIYNKEIMTKEDLKGTVNLTILVNEKNNFIEEISYEIDDLNINNNENNLFKYKVRIKNTNINNTEEIILPFKKSE